MKLEQSFGSWYPLLEPLLKSPIFEHIGSELMRLHNQRVQIAPSFNDMFRAFSECNEADCRVILVGQCPYPQKGVADGLCFSTRESTAPTPPSLLHIMKAWEQDFADGFDLNAYRNTDLTYLANSGVLMLNTALSVEIGKPGSHLDLWKPFTSQVIKAISHYKTGLVFILLGSHAQELRSVIDERKHTVLVAEHPENDDSCRWNHEQIFLKTNNVLNFLYSKPIDWISKKV